jgi:subtilisin family serine protease
VTRTVFAALAVLLVAAAPSSAVGAGDVQAPSLDSYIVVLKPGAARSAAAPPSQQPLVAAVAQELSRAHGGAVTSLYQYALKGFAVRLSARQADALANDPRVEYVEVDQVFSIDATQSPATWGLDRIDQRDLPLNNAYTYNQTGQGVHAYIIDTGIRETHQEFTGRMGNGFTAVNDGQGTNDCNGHGTHVAGTTGGTTYGVAKAVTLHAVRVLSCSGSGSTSGVIAGVDWVTQNHTTFPAVANMSLGGGISSALDNAVVNSINDGVSYAIAAGNSNANACNSSPARVASAITVGSTTSSDARSSFSNFGTCVDIFAPGSSITSSWNTSNTATNTISGTSMATPHVAGAVALFLQNNTTATPTQATTALVGNSTPNKVTNAGTGSPNRLLYSLFGGGSPGDTIPPTTAITSPTNGATVSGTTTVSASASDSVGVASVEFYVDGSQLGSDSTSPYQIAWNTTLVGNGNHGLQTKALDAAGNFFWSTVVTVNVSNAAGGGELIVNGGFEGSASPWSLSGNAYWSAGGNQHSGSGYTVLGFYNNANGTEYQTVSIPAGRATNLTFWLNITTSESLSTAYDFLYAEVRSTTGALLGTLAMYSNRNAASGYFQKSFSLASWNGQTVRVQFRATTDGSLTSAFRVDDVSLR